IALPRLRKGAGRSPSRTAKARDFVRRIATTRSSTRFDPRENDAAPGLLYESPGWLAPAVERLRRPPPLHQARPRRAFAIADRPPTREVLHYRAAGGKRS